MKDDCYYEEGQYRFRTREEYFDDKADRIFRILDTDGSGSITAEDFMSVAQRVVDAFGLPAKSAQARRVNQAARDFWTRLSTAVDTDRDGTLTREEFAVVSRGHLLGGTSPVARSAEEWVDAIVSAADTDHDDVLSEDEYTRLLRAFGSPEGGIRLIIDHMVGADGTVATDRARLAFLGAYTTDVPVKRNPALAGV
ncbi:EF-hand domain-containing protein [Streptomyces montanisoli]|uniref:EF-hand domain-containing protein n=1 Tax=Streptomyces montanisoli TaxID=2798581 RepID=A0A940RZ79_9ACTN|nr:EF-hand domain-containing protein [Streptomyces montanisoli]MBP0459983.1 EF-hand domain-containing protein [Streptomyces montanisoli]